MLKSETFAVKARYLMDSIIYSCLSFI